MKGKEYKNKSTKEKEIYFFKFEDDEFPERKTREVFTKKEIETYYPFYNDKQKYRYIEKITFEGVSPKSIKGVAKAVNRGLGLTRNLSPIIRALESTPAINEIIISKKEDSEIKRNQITISVSDLERLFSVLKPFNDKQDQEKKKITNNVLSDIFPKKFKKLESEYTKGDLMEFIVNKDLENNEISEEDIKHIIKILPREIREQKVVYQIEEKIELIKVKNVKKEFEKLSEQETDSNVLEKKWHKFFKENDWVFSHILLLPVTIYDDEVYVGGKNAQNKDGKVADFLYKNSLSGNACLIEIKTHKSKICNKRPYRGKNVFELNGKFTGAINQALRQKHDIQKDYASLLTQEKERGKADQFFEVFNPKVVLIAGSLSDLTKTQRNNFEIFRNSISNIDIITFDEIKEKLEYFLSLLEIK